VSPMTMTVRRRLLVVGSLVLVAALLVWLIASRAGDSDSSKDAEPDSGDAVAAASTPGAEPSSGPAGTPSPGSLDEVPVEEATTEPAIPLTATADFGTGMKLRIVKMESVAGKARGTGEIAGPALRLTLRMSNGSDSAVSLESAIVDATTGKDKTPAPTLSGPGAKPFEGEVAAGEAMTAVYVFGVPEDARDRLQVAVSYVADAPVVAFAGAPE
jgi:hypothetical protein